jgi:hypothetical protein
LRPRSRGVVVYFLSVILTIVVINTSVPRVVLSALLGNVAGSSISDTLQTFSRDLFLLLMVSLYFEWARSREQLDLLEGIRQGVDQINDAVVRSTPEAVRKLALGLTSPEELMRTAVNRILPAGADPTTIISRILSDRVPYRDVTAELRVESVSEDRLKILYRIIFTSHGSEPIFGVTRKSEHSAALSSAYADLFDVFTFPGASFEEVGSGGTASIRLYYRRSVERHFNQVELVRATARINPDLFSRLPPGLNKSDIAFFQPVKSFTNTSEYVRFRVEATWEQDSLVRFLYWCTDRMMFVRQLTFDARQLSSMISSVAFQPFLGNMADVLVDIEDLHVTVRLDAWLFEGHGAVIIW